MAVNKVIEVYKQGPQGVAGTDGTDGDVSFNQLVVIQSVEDFPNPLLSTEQYLIDGKIDVGAVQLEVPEDGLYLAGHNFELSSIFSSVDNHTMFTSPVDGSGPVFARDVTITTSGASSRVYNIKAKTGLEAIELVRVNYTSCTSLGVIDGYRQGLEEGTGRLFGSPELELKGTWLGGFRITTSIVRFLDAGFTGSLFKAGAGLTFGSRFLTDMNVDLPANAAFTDFSEANFPVISTLQISGAIFTREGIANAEDTGYFPNITHASLASSWRSNQGLPNTLQGGVTSVATQVATVIGLPNQSYPILGTFAVTELQHFDSPAEGQLRHVGVDPRNYTLFGDINLEGTKDDLIAINVMKWDESSGISVNLFTQERPIASWSGPRDVAAFTLNLGIILDKNDYIYLEVVNETAARNVTAEVSSFIAIRTAN